MGLRRKGSGQAAAEHPVVDLDDYEIIDDPTDIRVKVAEIRGAGDTDSVLHFIGRGDILILDMSAFPGSDGERNDLLENIHRNARSEGYSMNGNGTVYVLAPTKVTVKRI